MYTMLKTIILHWALILPKAFMTLGEKDKDGPMNLNQ